MSEQIRNYNQLSNPGHQEVLAGLDQSLSTPEIAQLGHIITRHDIRSSMGPFHVLPEYRVQYPEVVTDALGKLFMEYNTAFTPLVEANREWETDYRFSVDRNGLPINHFVQIDMVGLPDQFLDSIRGVQLETVQEALRGRIFEIENSLAMYTLIENIFSRNGERSFFDTRFRASLDEIRSTHGKPIALLAVTDQKHEAMRTTEFGKNTDEILTDEEVYELSGFDRLFGPGEFEQYIAENGGNCDYLLYARTSDPVAKLRKPDTRVAVPLLENDRMRKIIKEHAITFNVDNPHWSNGDIRRINDTKAYLPIMRMAFPAVYESDIYSQDLIDYLRNNNGSFQSFPGESRLSPGLVEYLQSQGVNPSDVESGQTILRFKPMQGTYGCYGHFNDSIGNSKLRQEIRKNMRDRGPYIIQPEMSSPIITNENDGQRYTYIDRNFFALTHGQPQFLGGFRTLMPLDTTEATRGRVHGNNSTVWAEVY